MELTEIREQINRVDDELLPLFLRRMELSARVAAYKKEAGMPVYDAAREQAILDKISGRAGEMGEYARQLYREIMRLSRAYQEQLLTEGNGFSRSAAEKGEA